MSYDGNTTYAYSSDGTDSKAYTNAYNDYTHVESYNSDRGIYSSTYYDNKYGGAKTETYDYNYGTTTYSETGYNSK